MFRVPVNMVNCEQGNHDLFYIKRTTHRGSRSLTTDSRVRASLDVVPLTSTVSLVKWQTEMVGGSGIYDDRGQGQGEESGLPDHDEVIQMVEKRGLRREKAKAQ